ncbi:MAG: hypothetical protein SFY81_13420 [Verrucomicrobiota bacterium]|nr:hypothetical protein [Verrucomicrobiota bacterium]
MNPLKSRIHHSSLQITLLYSYLQSVRAPLLLLSCLAAVPLLAELIPILTPKKADGLASIIQPHEKVPPETTVLFRAFKTNFWPHGLIPIFLVERKGQVRLQSLPPRGQEHLIEPLFFALPPTHAASNTLLAGRWEITAWRNGSTLPIGLELAADGDTVSGRFDQNTDYRFAFISNARLTKTNSITHSHLFTFKVDYVADQFDLSAELTPAGLKGIWKKSDGSEEGAWTAIRPKFSPLQLPPDPIPLYEWRRASDNFHRYSIEDLPSGWIRSDQPFCLVWKPK